MGLSVKPTVLIGAIDKYLFATHKRPVKKGERKPTHLVRINSDGRGYHPLGISNMG